MMIAAIVAGFALVLWQLSAIERRQRQLLLELVKTKARIVDSDRRLSKRLYELSRLNLATNTAARRVQWHVVPLGQEHRENAFAGRLREAVNAEHAKDCGIVQDVDEVLPSDVDPSQSLRVVSWSELNKLSLADIETALNE